jgi:hypothetical protein
MVAYLKGRGSTSESYSSIEKDRGRVCIAAENV